MIVSVFFFILNNGIVFKLKNINNCNYEYSCRVASLVHSVISFIGSILYLNSYINLNYFNEIVKYNSIYILTDIFLYITKIISNKYIVEMMIHHIFFLIAGYLSYLNPTFYAYGIISEGSTIFLNLRWFAIQYKNQQKIKLYNKCFGISFFFFRIINITCLCYNMYNSSLYKYTIISIPFLILNYYWFYLLSLKIIK